MFHIQAPYEPSGDQPKAIASLVKGLKEGVKHQTVLGVTGSGKTFTMAHVIAQSQRPTLVMAPNKTLAAQLYAELKAFFPHNAVEYFVSYYDYYQPEAYVASSDTFIDKDAQINEQIEQMRLSATKALLERRDVIVVSSVSSIYGLGDPEEFQKMRLEFKVNDTIQQRSLLLKLAELQYQRNDTSLERGTFRVRGDNIDVWPGDQDTFAVRLEMFDNQLENIFILDPLTGKTQKSILKYTLYPKSHYTTSKENALRAIETIKAELKERMEGLYAQNLLVEAQRLKERTFYDLEMMKEVGYCNGVENYSRHFTGAQAGDPPPTLFDYLPSDGLVIVDESHVTVPQIGGMYKADRSRKETLVEFGFRLPSALDNRPLTFEEWENKIHQIVYVSATPGLYEEEHTQQTVELVVRPTGLLDPKVEVRPQESQVDDLLGEIKEVLKRQERVLVTTLTKKMAESLTEFLTDHGIKTRYLHSDIETLERMEILRDLRLGTFDVLIGINLLREGLDLPEVSLVAILDADKEGFLRSTRSLIQTIGRAARNVHGKAILYADKITPSMQQAMDETARRREKQIQYNQEQKITPTTIQRRIADVMMTNKKDSKRSKDKPDTTLKPQDQKKFGAMSEAEFAKEIKRMETTMKEHAKNLEFEKAVLLRDQIKQLKELRIALK